MGCALLVATQLEQFGIIRSMIQLNILKESLLLGVIVLPLIMNLYFHVLVGVVACTFFIIYQTFSCSTVYLFKLDMHIYMSLTTRLLVAETL